MVMDNKNWSTQIKKGYLELCVLLVIAKHKRVYGLELISMLENQKIDVKEGTLYPLLSRMTKDDQLSYKWELEGIKGHPKKYYMLTKSGDKFLLDMQEEFEAMIDTYKKLKSAGGK